MKVLLRILVVIIAFSSLCFVRITWDLPIANKWMKIGHYHDIFQIGYTNDIYAEGRVFYIKSIKDMKGEMGAYKRITTIGYEGLNKDVKFSCIAKTKEIKQKAEFYIFVTNEETGKKISNKIELIKSNNWEKYEICISDIPYTQVIYGIKLFDNGRVDFSEIKVEILDK